MKSMITKDYTGSLKEERESLSQIEMTDGNEKHENSK